MSSWLVVVLVAYGVVLASYMIAKIAKVDRRKRGVVKMTLVVIFVAVAIYGVFVNKASVVSVLTLVALLFAGTGDYFLIFADNKAMFHRGIVSFALANATLLTMLVTSGMWSYWALVPYIIINIFNIIAQNKVYSYGSSKIYLNIYFPLVSLSGCCGAILLFSSLPTAVVLLCIGMMLFFVSDVLLGLYFFKYKNRTIDVLNSLTYFSAMMLIALSVIVL